MTEINNHNYDDDDVLLWGARSIGAAIGMNASKAFRMLEAGTIKSARKHGGRWCGWRRQLRREFGLYDTVAKATDGKEARTT